MLPLIQFIVTGIKHQKNYCERTIDYLLFFKFMISKLKCKCKTGRQRNEE